MYFPFKLEVMKAEMLFCWDMNTGNPAGGETLSVMLFLMTVSTKSETSASLFNINLGKEIHLLQECVVILLRHNLNYSSRQLRYMRLG